MANIVKIKRSAVASKIPITTDLELGELAINTFDGKLFTKKDDGTVSIIEIGSGGGGITYSLKTANYTAKDKDGILANTSAGTFTVTLPASPDIGASVVINDAADSFGTNNLIVARNGSTIETIADNLILDLSSVSVSFIYTGTTWQVYSLVVTNVLEGTYATGTGSASGTNTGDNAVNSLYSGLVSNATHTGDVTGSTALTLATVNSNIGTWNNVTVNAKGLVTGGSNASYLTTVSPSNFSSQTANAILAAPNGSAGVPTFRAIVAADIPTLNQNTTGTASNVTGTVAIANGGTGATTAAGAVSALGAYAATNPSGYTSNTGTVTSVGGTGTVNGLSLSGTVTSSGSLTLGGTLSGVSLTTQVSGTLPVGNGGTGATTLTTNNVILGNGTSAVQVVAPGTSGNLLTSNGSTWVSQAPSGGGGIVYTARTTNYTAVDKDGILANTTSGVFTVTLPASPATGAQVIIADANDTWSTNNLTVARNGATIEGLVENLICDISGISVQLIYTGTTWQVYSQVGALSSTGPLPVDKGGTGVSTLTSNAILVGNGTSGVTSVSPGTDGNILTSNGTTWASSAPSPSFTTGKAIAMAIVFGG